MGCGSSQPAVDEHKGGGRGSGRGSARGEQHVRESLAALADVGAVRTSTRTLSMTAVQEQRKQRFEELRLSSRSPARTGAIRGEAAGSKNTFNRSSTKRMSRLGSVKRREMVDHVQTAANAKESVKPGGRQADAASFLKERLRQLGMAPCIMDGDGNCQFRAFADQLFGDQRHHAVVRLSVVEHIRAHQDFFGMFFETPSALHVYLQSMSKSRTWGDELTLRAAVEAYQCVVHLITSDDENWYLVYQPDPDSQITEGKERKCHVPHAAQMPRFGKEVFLSYISPIHYNAIMGRVTDPAPVPRV